MRLSKAMLAMAAVALGLSARAADPPASIRLPGLPTPDAPKPPPDSVVKLSEGQLYVIDSDVQLVVLSSPAGTLVASEEAGPVKMRGEFVDAPGKPTTRTFKGKWVYTVDVTATGRAELLIIPIGVAGEKDVLRRTLDANLGPRPPPVPPVPPAPPTPATKPWGFVLIDNAVTPTPNRGQILNDAIAYCQANGLKWRDGYSTTVDATGQPPADLKPYIADAKGKPLPRLYVVDDKGVRLFEGDLPADGIVPTLKRLNGGK